MVSSSPDWLWTYPGLRHGDDVNWRCGQILLSQHRRGNNKCRAEPGPDPPLRRLGMRNRGGLQPVEPGDVGHDLCASKTENVCEHKIISPVRTKRNADLFCSLRNA